MANPFNDLKVHADKLLSILPTQAIEKVSDDLNVDYHIKKLTGLCLLRSMMLALLVSDEISQRKVCATEASEITRTLFHEAMGLGCSHSSLSERLSKIDPEFFQRSYDLLYRQAISLYDPAELLRDNFIRVDSSMISETTKKLLKAMNTGQKPRGNKDRKGMFKVSLAFDDFGVLNASIFNDNIYYSEDLALPECLESALRHIKGNPDLFVADQEVALVDRGVASLANFKRLNEMIHFVARLKINRHMEVISDRLSGKDCIDIGDLEIYSDSLVHLKGKGKHYDHTVFRVVKARYKEGRKPRQHSGSGHKQKKLDSEIWLVTNIEDVDADVIFAYYMRRWDIEVFFRFLKQNLSMKHIISTSENGVKVMIYLVLTAALLLMIYKKLNEVGWNMAKYLFRLDLMSMEIEAKSCTENPSIGLNSNHYCQSPPA